MSEAVVVHQVYKKFGLPGLPGVKGFSRLSAKALGMPEVSGYRPFVVALDHVSFSVHEGEIFGVLGPVGSGKSTLIRLLATLLLPDSGYIRLFGYDVMRQPMQVQRLINRVSGEASFYKQLSPVENLLQGARLHGKYGLQARRQVVDTLCRLGLEEGEIDRPMEEMPRSAQQLVAIARALLSHARVLLLDEPTFGLDVSSKRAVQQMLRELRDEDGTTILLATHDLAEAYELCDRMAVLQEGKIIAQDVPAGIVQRNSQNEVEPSLEDTFLGLASRQLA